MFSFETVARGVWSQWRQAKVKWEMSDQQKGCSMIDQLKTGFGGMGVAFAALGLFAVQPSFGQNLDHVPQAIGVPIKIEIDADERSISVNARVMLTITVTATADLDDVRVRTSAWGDVRIITPIDTTIPTLPKDEVVQLFLPVRPTRTGEWEVDVDVEAVIAGIGPGTHPVVQRGLRDTVPGPEDGPRPRRQSDAVARRRDRSRDRS